MNIKSTIARKIGRLSKKIPGRYSIYNNGKYDPDESPGHGIRNNQGLTNYMNDMLKREEEGKFKFE